MNHKLILVISFYLLTTARLLSAQPIVLFEMTHPQESIPLESFISDKIFLIQDTLRSLQEGAPPSKLTIPLLGDLVEFHRTDNWQPSIPTRSIGNLWTGKIVGSQKQAVLTTVDGVMSGYIQGPYGNFVIVPGPDGQRLILVDQEQLPTCDQHGGELSPAAHQLAHRFSKDPSFPFLKDDERARIEALELYVPEVLELAGSTAGVLATVQNAYDILNVALANSDIPGDIFLVDVVPVEYATTGNPILDLDWLAGQLVQPYIIKYSVDLLGLVVDASTACGRARVLRDIEQAGPYWGQHLTRFDCAVANLSLAHEVGHNLGMEHNFENGGSPVDASRPWSFSHYSDGHFACVMTVTSACSEGCARHLHFSNPNVAINGTPTGITNERDNARTARETIYLMQSYNSPSPFLPLFSDSFESGDLSAWRPSDRQ